ncbi:MAG: GTPase, partial [Nanoarchaeota archaeon]
MPINAGYEYFEKEKEYLKADNLDDKIHWLEEMIKAAPKHKSSENFVAELKRRLIKLNEKKEKASKKSGGRKGIRKEGFQFVLFGLTGKGKTQLLTSLTNAKTIIKGTMFSTKAPEIGTFEFQGVKAQIVDTPSIGSEDFDSGIINNADCLLIVIETLEEIEEVSKYLGRATENRIIIVNKKDNYDEERKRKMIERMKSKKVNGFFISALQKNGFR